MRVPEDSCGHSPRMVSADPRCRGQRGQGRRRRASTSLPAGSTPSSRRAQSSACAPARPRSAPPLRLWGMRVREVVARAQHERHVGLDAALGAHLADQAHADQRRVLGQRAEQELEQRPREALERHRRRDRIAGDADHRRPLHHAERDRVRRAAARRRARRARRAAASTAGRVVGAAARGARDHEHEVGVGAAAPSSAAPIASASSGRGGQALARRRPRRARAPAASGRRRRRPRPAQARVPGGRSSPPVGRIDDGRAPRHVELGMAGDGRQRDVVAREQAAGREQQHRPRARPRRRRARSCRLPSGLLDEQARRRSRSRSRPGRRRRSDPRPAARCRCGA